MSTTPGTIRIAMMATGFVALTLALIILQPGPRRGDDQIAAEPRVVTRSTADLVEMPAVTPEPAMPVVDLPAVAPAPAPRPVDQVFTEVAAAAALAERAQTAERTPARTAATEAPPVEMREMSWSILESLNAHSGRDVAPGEPGSLLHTIVTRAVEDAAATRPDLDLRKPGGRTAPAPEAGSNYVVQRDDTLMLIAQRVYGDAAAFSLIFEANKDRMSNPEDLRVGQVLRLPPR